MKVFICKFFNDKGIEDRIGRLVSREKKRAGNNLRVFCVHEQTQKRLELAGISSEAYYEFDCIDAEDESTWEKAYQLSDALHSSTENDDTLKYSGINFLTLEHCPAYYTYAIRLANLFRRMLEQNCGVLIVVVPKEYSVWLCDINSPNIKTIRYDNVVKSFITRLYHHVLYQGSWLLEVPFNLIKSCFKRSVPEGQPVPAEKMGQRQPKVLFVVRTPLYARPALAICDECLRDELIPYITTDNRALALLWQSRHIGYLVKPLFTSSLISLAPRIGEFLSLFYRLRRHVNSFYDSSNYLDAMLDEFSAAYLCKRILLDRLPWLCYEAITNIVFLERLINITSPDIICLMPQDHFLQQIASTLAKEKYNIPTLACSAAWETGTASSFRRHLHADKLATSGRKMRDMYITSGLEPERVFATGIAHFDLAFNRNREQDKQILLECAVDPGKSIIVFASDAFSISETEETLIGVIDTVLKNEDMQLVVKVHPREEAEPFHTIAGRYHDPRIRVFKDIDLYALLNNCELLITKGSTVALEAMMIGKPVIIIDLSGKPIGVPYTEEGAAIGVYRYQDIEPAILKALYDEETRSSLKVQRDEFVRNWAGAPDGRASQRIVTLMKEMIGARTV